jgi:NADH-quinone oxidoreductase subunit G
MPTIYVDNVPYEVPEGRNLLAACLSLGFNLPYFCWHPAMHSVGACRQCAVKLFKDEKDTKGQIVMACMTPAADGTRISIDDPEARAMRGAVVELLMTNHPHDCPVCDEGGECHLQDMTVMTGHTYRRFRFKKRTYTNQDLGPFVNHEMNRCIQCYRCTRFYNDYAGGRDFGVFGWHNRVYFGRHADGALESEFSGNLVEVCPTGVFTDKTLKEHYTRKWDLQTAPSVCVHCGLGCNTIPGERYGVLRRIRNRYNGEVNGYFLCDRGRYGYEFVNSDRRIRRALVRAAETGADVARLARPAVDGDAESQVGVARLARPAVEASAPSPTAGQASRATCATREDALRRAAELLREPGRAVGLGSPRASLEANFALRALVGPERFCAGVCDAEGRLLALAIDILRRGPARAASMHDAARADAVLVLGEDVTNSAPRLALALRQSVLHKGAAEARKLGVAEWDDGGNREVTQHDLGPFFVASPDAGKLDEVATDVYRAAPDDIARLGFAVAHALCADAPAVPDLPDGVRALADRIAAALREAGRPLVVSGLGCRSEAVMQAAANVASALCAAGRPAGICLTVPEANSIGLALTGGGPLSAAAEMLRNGAADTLIVLENDLYRRAGRAAVDALFAAARHVIVIDHLAGATVERAEIVLPAATFAEGDGTLVSSEGRAQRYFKVFAPEGDVQDSWRWLRDLAIAAGRLDVFSGSPFSPLPAEGEGVRGQSKCGAWPALDAVIAAMAAAMPVFAPVLEVAPHADFRIAGARLPREPHRYSGRTATHADRSVHEQQPPEDPDSPLAFSMEGYSGPPPAPLIREYWAPGWNSVQALNKFQQEVGGPLLGGDPGRRLIEPAAGARPAWLGDVPPAFRPVAEVVQIGAAASGARGLAAALYHIFGSEELSALSRGIAQRSPEPYVALRPEDAARIGAKEGGLVCVTAAGAEHRLPVRLRPSLPEGVVGLPVGLAGGPVVELPAWVEVSRS